MVCADTYVSMGNEQVDMRRHLGSDGRSMPVVFVLLVSTERLVYVSPQVAPVLAAAGYYQKFIQDYARMVKPIRQVQHECMHKLQKIRWGEEQEKAFCGLKAMMAPAPMLMRPRFDGRPFMCLTDCSNEGM